MKVKRADLDRLKRELQQRFDVLEFVLKGRELKDSREGCKGKWRWQKPELLCAIEKNDVDLALDDFKTVLSILKKLK